METQTRCTSGQFSEEEGVSQDEGFCDDGNKVRSASHVLQFAVPCGLSWLTIELILRSSHAGCDRNSLSISRLIIEARAPQQIG